MRLPILLLALLSLAARPAPAQAPAPTLGPGDQVRVSAPSLGPGRVQGTVVRFHGDTLGVREEDGRVRTVHVATITRLSKRLGIDRRRSVRRSAGFGLFLGTATGLIAGGLIASGADTEDFGTKMAVSGGIGALAGGALGAGYGAVFARERWQPFRLPFRVGPAAGGGAAVSLRVPLP